MLEGLGHVAVGAASPIPGAAALLARERSGGRLRVSVLGSERHNPFTDGGRELFDCAAKGRIDAFFLGGGQIDGGANINLVGVGGYPASKVRWPGSFGSAYLYFLVPRVILFREEHTTRVLVPQVEFVSAPGHEPGQRLSPGRALRAGHRPRRVPLRACPRALLAGKACIRAKPSPRSRGTHRLRLRYAGRRRGDAGAAAATLALIRGPVGRAIAETFRALPGRCSAIAAGGE